eukprot:m.131130 g.131130  ORF g.131130 m.131130 type:complete len:303 (-) comp29523_c1_seq1:331-1239(-)
MATGLSEYEQQRLANIESNKKMMMLLGLDCSSLTLPALGKKAPLKQKSRPLRPKKNEKEVPTSTRQSARLVGSQSIDYADNVDSEQTTSTLDTKPVQSAKRRRVTHVTKSPAKLVQVNPRSCKQLQADLISLAKSSLGKIIPPLGGQVKRAAMEALSGEGPPTFSRMSGIQEWSNAIALFVNVYGDGYKNVLLENGSSITWFAQSQQWEGTPVIQRMIHCAGAEIETDDGDKIEFEPTPVVLFCREVNKGYVYCGELGYMGHDPERLPIRFVWKLKQVEQLRKQSDFVDLVKTCNSLFADES